MQGRDPASLAARNPPSQGDNALHYTAPRSTRQGARSPRCPHSQNSPYPCCSMASPAVNLPTRSATSTLTARASQAAEDWPSQPTREFLFVRVPKSRPDGLARLAVVFASPSVDRLSSEGFLWKRLLRAEEENGASRRPPWDYDYRSTRATLGTNVKSAESKHSQRLVLISVL